MCGSSTLGMVLLLRVKRLLPDCPAGKVQRSRSQLLDLMRSLAEAGRHSAALQFVLRPIKPFP